MTEREQIIQRIRDGERQIQRVERERADWIAHRADGGRQVMVSEFDTTNVLTATEVNGGGWAGIESVFQGRLAGLRGDVERSRHELLDLIRRSPLNERVAVNVDDCFLADGGGVHQGGTALGAIEQVCGPFLAIRLDSPLDLFETELRAVNTIYGHIASVRFLSVLTEA